MPIIKTDKETILKDSIALFKLHGYHNTTMAKIGEACGLIKGSIYHYFKSKEELGLESLRYIHRYFEEIFSPSRTESIYPTVKKLPFSSKKQMNIF